MSSEDPKFESRKKDHIVQSLNEHNQVGLSPSDEIRLFHKAMPEINFEDISLKTKIFSKEMSSSKTKSTAGQSIELSSPIFVSSMTAGHEQGEKINYNLAKACAEKNWLFAVGSQRKQLADSKKNLEWAQILKDFPKLNTVGNLGLAQLISHGPDKALKLVESLKAKALFIHCNPLQEVLQAEGTPQFKNGFKVLKELCELSPVPIILKETGCGFDKGTLKKLSLIKKLYAVDVSGFGGTHWGRIEGQRNLATSALDSDTSSRINNNGKNKKTKNNLRIEQLNLDDAESKISNLDKFILASQTYAFWGISTAESLSYCAEILNKPNAKTKYWASGGIRSGLDVVTCLSMGAEMVGVAQPILKHVLEGYDSLIQYMDLLEFETKIGLFCTGNIDINSCHKDARWEWK